MNERRGKREQQRVSDKRSSEEGKKQSKIKSRLLHGAAESRLQQRAETRQMIQAHARLSSACVHLCFVAHTTERERDA